MYHLISDNPRFLVAALTIVVWSVRPCKNHSSYIAILSASAHARSRPLTLVTATPTWRPLCRNMDSRVTEQQTDQHGSLFYSVIRPSTRPRMRKHVSIHIRPSSGLLHLLLDGTGQVLSPAPQPSMLPCCSSILASNRERRWSRRWKSAMTRLTLPR